MKISSAILLVAIAITAVSCGGPPPDEPEVSIYADLEATQGWAREQGFKYCNIESDQICQSPDNLLQFKLPQRLHDAYVDRVVQNQMTIINNGLAPILITDYYMTAVDDSNHIYRAELEAPDRYRSTDVTEGGLELTSHDEVDIDFRMELRGPERMIQKVTFWYKLQGRPDTSRVVVSYRPSSYRSTRDRRAP